MTLVMSANLIQALYDNFTTIVKFIFQENPIPAYIPQAKAWGLGGKSDKVSIHASFDAKIQDVSEYSSITKFLLPFTTLNLRLSITAQF